MDSRRKFWALVIKLQCDYIIELHCLKLLKEKSNLQEISTCLTSISAQCDIRMISTQKSRELVLVRSMALLERRVHLSSRWRTMTDHTDHLGVTDMMHFPHTTSLLTSLVISNAAFEPPLRLSRTTWLNSAKRQSSGCSSCSNVDSSPSDGASSLQCCTWVSMFESGRLRVALALLASRLTLA